MAVPTQQQPCARRYSISGSFDFRKPLEWEKWIRRFQWFRQASNLHTTTRANQVNTLIYCIGDQADYILQNLKLSGQEINSYDAVKEDFHTFLRKEKYNL